VERDNECHAQEAAKTGARCLEALRNGEWTIVGQYPDKESAERIAEDYRSRGETVRVTHD
jgi:hypothetical protein